MKARKYSKQHQHEPTLEQQLDALPNAEDFILERNNRKVPSNIANITVPHQTATALSGDWTQLKKRTTTFLSIAQACATANGNMALLSRAGFDLDHLQESAVQFNQKAAGLLSRGIAFYTEHTTRLGQFEEKNGHNPGGILRQARRTSEKLREISLPEDCADAKLIRRALAASDLAMDFLNSKTKHPRNRGGYHDNRQYVHRPKRERGGRANANYL